MKTMKAKSIFYLILFSILTLGLASIATSAVTRITNNSFEESFPKTAGGYVVWQGQVGNDKEIFLYNANDGSGPFPITTNPYHDINPETDGNYVTWAAAAAPYGEIFLYNIATSTTTRLTTNAQYDHHPKIFDGMVVWVSHSEGVDTLVGPGDIVLYDIAENYNNNSDEIVIHNISAKVDNTNIYDDNAFRFDGNYIVWGHENDLLESVLYVYELATESIYRYIDPDEENSIPYITTDLEDMDHDARTDHRLTLQDNAQKEGDFTVFTRKVGGSDREIMINDLHRKRGGQITGNDIEDIQPAIKDNIVVWKGGEGNYSEIYLYEIQPLFADADYDFRMDFANVDFMVIPGKAGGGANQYRWLLGGTALTGWLPVVNGQAPLLLADKSGFVYGPQTLTLEVTDGENSASDQVTMDLQEWFIELVSPADGSEQLKGIYPEFTWSSSPSSYINFKIQISQTTEFLEAETVAYPSASDEWMRGTTFTADAATTQELDDLLSESPIAYWRVFSYDRYGSEKTSDIRSFIIIPPITLVSPDDGIEFDKKELPVFVWESSEDYIEFKIQLSTVASFEGTYTLTFPESDDAWLNEPSITLDKKQAIKLKELLGDEYKLNFLYWRVLAQDSSGNEEISQTRHLVNSK